MIYDPDCPPTTLALSDIAPYGWTCHGRVGVCMTPAQPCIQVGVHWYVPTPKTPRKWTGTVKDLADEVTREPWNWGDDVVIRIKEVIE